MVARIFFKLDNGDLLSVLQSSCYVLGRQREHKGFKIAGAGRASEA